MQPMEAMGVDFVVDTGAEKQTRWLWRHIVVKA